MYWWGLAFPSTRGKQTKSVTCEKVLALRGFECGGVSIWVLTSPRGRGRVQPLRGGVNPCGDSVYLQCSRRRQEDGVRSLPAGFKGLGLMSPYQHRISNLERMGAGNRVVCTVCGGYGFADFLFTNCRACRWACRVGEVIRADISQLKKRYAWRGASIDDFKGGKSMWAGCVSGPI